MSANSTLASALGVLARILFAFIFISSGAQKLGAHEATVGYIASGGMPIPAEFAYWAAVAIELGGGILIVLGFLARPAALAVAIFTIVAGFAFHYAKAKGADGAVDMNQMIHFFKNISMAGAALFIAASGAGPWSVDAKLFGGRG